MPFIIFSVIVIALQLLLSLKLKRVLTTFIPSIVFTLLTGVFIVLAYTARDWDAIAYIFFAIFTGIGVVLCLAVALTVAIIKAIIKHRVKN